jgi:hypothetical protein
MKQLIGIAIVLGVAAVALTQTRPAAAAGPTPVPGGANQVSGVSGPLSSTLFNGKVRIREMALRNATAAEYTPDGGNRGIIFSWLVSNGTSSARTGYFASSISDADGVVIDGKQTSVYSTFYTLQPGSAARATMQFIVPANFVPTKILLTDQGSPAGPAFRILLNPADVPAPSAT